MQRNESIAVARRLADGIVAKALWQDDATCTWQVQTLDRATGGPQPEVAGGGIYQGSGGIALFLGELLRLVGNEDAQDGDGELRRTAEGALRHALAAAEAMPHTSFSFHGGRVGAAYVATRLAEPLAKPEYLDAARRLLQPLAGHEAHDHGLDVIGGAAGAIPVLLWLRHALDDDSLLDIALGLGDRLITAARREPGGWSWNTVGPSATRNIVGHAHGTAGAALALLELYQASGQGRYRFAAEMAFLYERHLFDAATSNWPDLRHREMNEIYYSSEQDSLRSAEVAENLPPYQPRFMTAWCHGSPGIGLSRVRAFELTGQETYRHEAEAALKSTVASLEVLQQQGYSLCHGVGGNCELPLYGAEVLGNPELRQVAERCGQFGQTAYDGTDVPWPCGTIEQAQDPSLLLGEAGIGYFYLRLASPQVPSILLPRPPLPSQDVPQDGSFESQSRQAVEEYFGQTVRSLEALGLPAAEAVDIAPAKAPLATSPVEAAYAALVQLVEAQQGMARTLAEDAFELERRRYELVAVPNDLSRHFLRHLRRLPADEVAWQSSSFQLAEDCILLSTRWQWHKEEWQGTASVGPPEEEQAWLVARQGEKVVTRRLSPLAAALLTTLEPSAPLHEIVARLLGLLGGAPSEAERRQLGDRILHQLRELYRVGVVDALSVPVSIEDTAPIEDPVSIEDTVPIEDAVTAAAAISVS